MQIAERREIIASISTTKIKSEKEEISSEDEEEKSFLELDSSLPDDIYTLQNPSTIKSYEIDTSKSQIKSFLDEDFNNKLQNTNSENATTNTKELPPFVSDISPTFKKFENTKESTSHHVKDMPDAPMGDNSKSPPLAGPNVMNIILVAAECAPWSKTGNIPNQDSRMSFFLNLINNFLKLFFIGGLGDVAGALPKALAYRGHRVMVSSLSSLINNKIHHLCSSVHFFHEHLGSSTSLWKLC